MRMGRGIRVCFSGTEQGFVLYMCMGSRMGSVRSLSKGFQKLARENIDRARALCFVILGASRTPADSTIP